ncbi:MAG TPA: glucose-6-phosphate dehydrogenase [Bryobacteraceae bacterium]|jgi:glucose-6-phosphate 1-dehydrogenase|nr:glucose-6-phosphate dehydrogenase [Bryobacteraceae bacterium]
MQIAEDIAATDNNTGMGRPGDPCIMVIFGASGDLTKRKLIPALYNLAKDNLLSKEFALVGIARNELSSEQFRDMIGKEIGDYATTKVDPDLWHWFARRIYYMAGDFDDLAAYDRLRDLLGQIDKEHGTRGNYFYYLATAPNFFAPIVKRLGEAKLVIEDNGWRRVIIEKPFGRNYESAVALNKEIRQVLDEKQIYRIDHYLGKETVQNILVFRFANGIFEPIWNRRYIDHVQITVAETVGVEQRGGYYEKAGTLRDMVPNHIFQLISLTAMEPPISFDADVVRDEQAKILKAIPPPNDEEVLVRTVRGQYGEGIQDGVKVPAYRAEPLVAPDSRTETFVAMKLFIDNWRWADVPFYLRTGKRLPKRATQIAIQFKRAPFVLFRKTAVDRLEPNRLVLHLQPDEGISLSFGAKVPGPVVQIGDVNMNFNYTDYFNAAPQTGYERLLYDCMLGDATLFQRSDMVETAWHVVAPVLDVWEALPPRKFPNYAAGTWGPPEADELLAKDNRHWSTAE